MSKAALWIMLLYIFFACLSLVYGFFRNAGVAGFSTWSHWVIITAEFSLGMILIVFCKYLEISMTWPGDVEFDIDDHFGTGGLLCFIAVVFSSVKFLAFIILEFLVDTHIYTDAMTGKKPRFASQKIKDDTMSSKGKIFSGVISWANAYKRMQNRAQ